MSERDDGKDRYKSMQQETHNVFSLLGKIEKDQRKRRFKQKLIYWWKKLTFRG